MNVGNHRRGGARADTTAQAARLCLKGRVGAALLGAALTMWSSSALATPRDDLKMAFIDAAGQLNNLELDTALATIDRSVKTAKASGLPANDPALARLHALRAGILFANSAPRPDVVAALQDAVRCDYHVRLPIELRSAELQALLGQARRAVAKPTGAIIHSPPAGATGQDIEFAALVNTELPEGAQLAMYWRRRGTTGEFAALEMDVFGNYGTATVSAADHNGVDFEYFFYAFDSSGQQQLANLGDQENPLVLKLGGAAQAVPAGGRRGADPGADDEDDRPKNRKPTGLPRVFINIGVGTGFGLARGAADLTFRQFTPGFGGQSYGVAEQACAIERWTKGGASLAANANEFAASLNAIPAGDLDDYLPAGSSVEDLAAAYDPDYCNERHPVSTGMASAPFHIAPEVGVRVGRAVVISVFSRLQVVTGSQVFTDDQDKDLRQSFDQDVRSDNPQGVRQRPPFTWAVGAKVKYFFGKDERKFRVFAGGFAGYGTARLRVPMGFSNDRNGNSVPDALERSVDGVLNELGEVVDECQPVWPYNAACQPGEDGEGASDRLLAQQVAQARSRDAERIDTVKIGPGFAGVLVGFNYQVVKHFALFAELNVGGWFPNTSSLLFDINVGPVITF